MSSQSARRRAARNRILDLGGGKISKKSGEGGVRLQLRAGTQWRAGAGDEIYQYVKSMISIVAAHSIASFIPRRASESQLYGPLNPRI